MLMLLLPVQRHTRYHPTNTKHRGADATEIINDHTIIFIIVVIIIVIVALALVVAVLLVISQSGSFAFENLTEHHCCCYCTE